MHSVINVTNLKNNILLKKFSFAQIICSLHCLRLIAVAQLDKCHPQHNIASYRLHQLFLMQCNTVPEVS